MPNQDRTPAAKDLPCDLGEFLSARRNVPIETVTQELGEWLVAYETQASARSRRPGVRAL